MTTSALPYRARLFQIDLDLIGHQLLIESGGGTASIDLEAKAVARSIAR